MFKLKLFITFTRIYLNLFDVFLSFANFVKIINFRDCFAIFFSLNFINFNDVNLFRNELNDKIDEIFSSFKAKTLNIKY